MFRFEADVKEELKRFSHEKGLKLYECIYETKQETQEKWPRGRLGKETKPKVETVIIYVLRKLGKNGRMQGISVEGIEYCVNQQCRRRIYGSGIGEDV